MAPSPFSPRISRAPSAVALVCLLLPTNAFAWGPEGHTVVALIAERTLTTEANAEVGKLLDRGETLSSVATFADDYRTTCPATAPWHYVNVPLAAPDFDARRDCKAPQDCIVLAIERSIEILRDRKAPKADRSLALRLLVHWVGDLHQPLHATSNDDRGGNDQQVRLGGRSTNLHSLWDSVLIRLDGRSEVNLAKALFSSTTPATRTQLEKGTVGDWTRESHAAGKLAYEAIGAPPDKTRTLRLPDDYADEMQPLLADELLKGGLRLSRVLNEVLTTPGPAAAPATLAALRICAAP